MTNYAKKNKMICPMFSDGVQDFAQHKLFDS